MIMIGCVVGRIPPITLAGLEEDMDEFNCDAPCVEVVTKGI
jgi:hypothetical protein